MEAAKPVGISRATNAENETNQDVKAKKSTTTNRKTLKPCTHTHSSVGRSSRRWYGCTGIQTAHEIASKLDTHCTPTISPSH